MRIEVFSVDDDNNNNDDYFLLYVFFVVGIILSVLCGYFI